MQLDVVRVLSVPQDFMLTQREPYIVPHARAERINLKRDKRNALHAQQEPLPLGMGEALHVRLVRLANTVIQKEEHPVAPVNMGIINLKQGKRSV